MTTTDQAEFEPATDLVAQAILLPGSMRWVKRVRATPHRYLDARAPVVVRAIVNAEQAGVPVRFRISGDQAHAWLTGDQEPEGGAVSGEVVSLTDEEGVATAQLSVDGTGRHRVYAQVEGTPGKASPRIKQGKVPWTLKHRWSDAVPDGEGTYAEAYHEWVAANHTSFNNSLCLCNWWPLRLLVEYAAEHGLPIRLRYWPGSAPVEGERHWDMTTVKIRPSHQGHYGSKSSYYTRVKSTVTARMIGELNTVPQYEAAAHAGDLLIYDAGERFWHAQVIVSRAGGKVRISDGSTPKKIPRLREREYDGFQAAEDDYDYGYLYGESGRRWNFAQFDEEDAED